MLVYSCIKISIELTVIQLIYNINNASDTDHAPISLIGLTVGPFSKSG